MAQTKSDFLTLIVISAFSFMLATMFHEHGGHALVCAVLGGHIKELGAFYVNCDAMSLTAIHYRFVALAGPLASLLTGLAGLLFFAGTPKANAPLKYFLWHFATVNLMIAAGYLLFSGVIGIGDLGLDQDGAFYQAQPGWLYRILLTLLGGLAYFGVLRISLRMVDGFIGGEGTERIARAQTLALTSYFTGGVVAVLVGLLNPYGIIIVLVSSVASSMGGTSGLAWMMQLLNRKTITEDDPFVLPRSIKWIFVSILFVLAYTIVLGPTIYFK